MGRTYWFDCPRCGYRATVAGGADRGLNFSVLTIVCWDCKKLLDAVVRLRVPSGPMRSGFKTPLRSDAFGSDPLKGRPPEFPVLLKQLLYQGIREWKWVEFKPQCPTSPIHRVEPWLEPCLCPHCACAMEQNPRPFRIWD